MFFVQGKELGGKIGNTKTDSRKLEWYKNFTKKDNASYQTNTWAQISSYLK